MLYTPASTGAVVSVVASTPKRSLVTPLISCIPQIFATVRWTATALTGCCMSPCRGDYIITPVGCRALRAAWPYSPRGDSRCTFRLSAAWLRISCVSRSLSSPGYQPPINGWWRQKRHECSHSPLHWSLTSPVAPRRCRVPAHRTDTRRRCRSCCRRDRWS